MFILPRKIAKHSLFPLLLALFVGAPLIFWNARQYSMPMGYAGMFTLMAELIAQNQFRLPLEVPYYGPGGVPFAYPPLGLYILAVGMKITGKTFIFLRLLPPLFAWFSLIPLYFLALEVFHSRLSAAMTAILAAMSIQLYIPHAWAAGIVRAPAFGFMLSALVFFTRSFEKFTWRNVVWAGLFLGLTGLTHLSYLVFAMFWIFSWTLTHPSWRNWLIAARSTGIGLLTLFPWLGLMLFRYGFPVFYGALASHGNLHFLTVLSQPALLFSQLANGFHSLFQEQIVAVLIVAGISVELVQKRFSLPLMLLASFFLFPEDGERFIFTLGCLLASAGIGHLAQIMMARGKSFLLVASVALFILLAYLWGKSLDRINHFTPRLTSSALDMATFFRDETPHEAIYLALIPQDEAEWLPFLFRRQPLLSQWGSEWLGRYNEQTALMLQARHCQQIQDIHCLDDFLLQFPRQPTYLLTLKSDGLLGRSLSAYSDWKIVYENQRYLLWQNMQMR